jgi:hypothetical protein
MNMTTQIQIRVEEGELEALDEFRRRHRNPPSRPRAVLDLMLRALNEAKASTS